MEELIRKVLATLDLVEVKGKANIDYMLGCMIALEKIADAMAHNREALAKAQTEAVHTTDNPATISTPDPCVANIQVQQ